LRNGCLPPIPPIVDSVRRPRFDVASALVVIFLAGACTPPAAPPADAAPSGPPMRTTWQLRHRVVESAELRIDGQGIGQYDESTTVSLGAQGDPSAKSCSVSVSVPGQGGPDDMVGEKVATELGGRPAVRNGAGAEGAYLMWQLTDGSWVMATCDDPDDHASVSRVAAAVRLTPSSIHIPFAVDKLPAGYEVSSIGTGRDPASAHVYVGTVQPAFGLPGSDIEIAYAPRQETGQPVGRPLTINQRPALVSSEPTSPSVCVGVQAEYVCVWSYVSDTGPRPDRSGDLPVLTAIAESLRFAADLDDRSTWFAADKVFG
jgi:hypothetical protein